MTRAVAVGAGFVLGIWLSRGWHESDWLAALLALIVLAAYLLARSFGMRASVPALLAAAVLLGLARGGPELLTPHGNLHLFHGRTVEVSGHGLRYAGSGGQPHPCNGRRRQRYRAVGSAARLGAHLDVGRADPMD